MLDVIARLIDCPERVENHYLPRNDKKNIEKSHLSEIVESSSEEYFSCEEESDETSYSSLMHQESAEQEGSLSKKEMQKLTMVVYHACNAIWKNEGVAPGLIPKVKQREIAPRSFRAIPWNPEKGRAMQEARMKERQIIQPIYQ